MAQVEGECKRFEHMHKSIALLSKGGGVGHPPQSRKFWQIGHNCEQRFTHVTRIEIFHWHLCYDLLKLAQMDGSAIFVLHTITHSLYCYNWTFHCFLLLTPDIFAPFVFVLFYMKTVINHDTHAAKKHIQEYCDTTRGVSGI